MKIVVLCEGATEEALKQGLREFVQSRAEGVRRVGIETRSLDGPVLRKKLARLVELNLAKIETVAPMVRKSAANGGRGATQRTKTWPGALISAPKPVRRQPANVQ